MNPSRFFLGFGLMATTLVSTAAPSHAATTSPKAYIGLFKDNAVAVLDTASNQVLKTIPIPAGPHGLVVTPDGRWVYASSDGASVVSVIDTSTDSVTNTHRRRPDAARTGHHARRQPRCWSPASAPTRSRPSTPPPIRSSWQVAVPQPHNIAITPGRQDGLRRRPAGRQRQRWRSSTLPAAPRPAPCRSTTRRAR